MVDSGAMPPMMPRVFIAASLCVARPWSVWLDRRPEVVPPKMRRWIRSSFVVALFVLTTPLFAQTFVFHLRGDQEVPPVPSVASSGCMGQLDQPGATFALTCVHDVV